MYKLKKILFIAFTGLFTIGSVYANSSGALMITSGNSPHFCLCGADANGNKIASVPAGKGVGFQMVPFSSISTGTYKFYIAPVKDPNICTGSDTPCNSLSNKIPVGSFYLKIDSQTNTANISNVAGIQGFSVEPSTGKNLETITVTYSPSSHQE